MTINYAMITTAIAAATEIFSQQTADDVAVLKGHFGQMYNEANIIAEIAVKLVLHIGQISIETRALSPVDALVYDALQQYDARDRGGFTQKSGSAAGADPTPDRVVPLGR